MVEREDYIGASLKRFVEACELYLRLLPTSGSQVAHHTLVEKYGYAAAERIGFFCYNKRLTARSFGRIVINESCLSWDKVIVEEHFFPHKRICVNGRMMELVP